jgi:transposase
MQVDTRPDTMKNIASYYGVKGRKLQSHYKHQISGYKEWEQYEHAEDYLIYPNNLTEDLSIDEVSLSKGELYTIVTNKKTRVRNKNSLVAVINGTESKKIEEVLDKIPAEKRNKVKEVSMDMAANMSLATRNSFPNSKQVIDRFHVVKLIMDALQHMRTNLRWKAIDAENQAIKKAKAEGRKYKPEILANGDTLKELLVRSRYLLYKFEDDWTQNQSNRAKVLFEKYPLIEKAYKQTVSFRTIYKVQFKEDAIVKFREWKQKMIKLEIEEFNSVVNSLEHHLDNILNFFNNRNTNANAESFNSKIKHFRVNGQNSWSKPL